MRRLILEEPWSAAALWSRRLALFALTVGAISVVLARSGLVDVTAVLAVFGAAVIVACLGLLLGGAGSVVIWRTGRRGMGSIVVGALLAPARLPRRCRHHPPARRRRSQSAHSGEGM